MRETPVSRNQGDDDGRFRGRVSAPSEQANLTASLSSRHVRITIGRRSTEGAGGTAATEAASTLRHLVREVRALVADLEGLRAENESLQAERHALIAAFTAIDQRLGRRPGARNATERAATSTGGRASPPRRRAPHPSLGHGGLHRPAEVWGRLHLDRQSRIVRIDGQEVSLAPRAFDLLGYLLDQRGQTLTRQTILGAVWSAARTDDSRTLRWHINHLRTRLEPFGPLPIRIVTVHRIGYRVDVDEVGGHG